MVHGGRYPAQASFLLDENAREFYEYSKQVDVLILGKTKWPAEQNYKITSSIRSLRLLACGATRSLVIRDCDENLAEWIARNDLDHIHNLVIVKVAFIGRDC